MRVTSALRLAVAAVIIVLLARAARAAWGQRVVAVAVWRRIRLRHVAGSVVLLAGVLAVAVGLMLLVPPTAYGAGSVIGLTGNAIFAPVEEAAVRSGSVGGSEAHLVMQATTVATVAFLLALLALFPWLAYVEERVFREGIEDAGLLQRWWSALRFGLVHLVMLVPLAAALAIGVAGLFYGRMYLRAYRRAAGDLLLGPGAARDRAILESTVWHTTFNSTIVVLLIAGVVTGQV